MRCLSGGHVSWLLVCLFFSNKRMKRYIKTTSSMIQQKNKSNSDIKLLNFHAAITTDFIGLEMKWTNKEVSVLSNKMIWHSHNFGEKNGEMETSRSTFLILFLEVRSRHFYFRNKNFLEADFFWTHSFFGLKNFFGQTFFLWNFFCI